MSARAWRLLLPVWLCAGLVGWYLDGPHPLASSIVLEGSGALAAAVALRGAGRARGLHRTALTLIASGLALWVAGDIAWDWFKLHSGTAPEVSIADIAYLVGYPVIALGLLAMMRLRSPTNGREGLLDGLALTGAAAIAMWQYLIIPSIDGVHGVQRFLNATYPLMDVVLLLGITWLAFSPGRRGAPTRLLFAGVSLTLVLDLAFAIVPRFSETFSIDPINALYPLAYGLIALAVAHPDAEELTDTTVTAYRPLHPARVAFLGIALLVPPVINAVEYAKRHHASEPLLIGTTILIGGIVFARFAGLLRDREQAQASLAFQASHDGLTGLLNRYLLADRIDHALIRAARQSTTLAVLYLDLDRFKAVNDTLGHQAGDTVLLEASRRVLDAVRVGDTVARLGGDEFAVMCEDLVDANVAFEIADRIVDSLAAPFAIGENMVVVSASVGVALHSSSSDTADSLLRDADAAMYRAKESGRDRWEVFDTEMRAWLDRRRDTETALQAAVKHDELRLHYQPVVRVATGEIVGFEALVRWDRPGHGLVQPLEFVGLAEETGLIVPIGEWVLERSCAQLADWNRAFPDLDPLRMNVNVSGRQLNQANLTDIVRDNIERAGLTPDRVTLELTESILLEDADWALCQLQSIRALGVRLAIDDFGTGYSALAYLRQFPIDVVKIDRAFMQDVGSASPAATVVAAVIALAHALGLEVVAEGTESDSQVEALRIFGCDCAQGFYYSRPLTSVQVEALLASAGHASRATVRELRALEAA